MIYGFRTKPLQHQIDTVIRAKQLGNCAILNEQGTGKTKCSIDLIDDRVDQTGELQRTLVVCPNDVVAVWLDEIAKHSRYYADKAIPVRHYKRDKRIEIATSDEPGIYVVNYEGVAALKYLPGTKKIAPYHLPRLPWDMVIADEATKVQHRSSKQTQAMHDFARMGNPAIRIAMTGTPILNNPLTVFSIAKFFDPDLFGSVYLQFEARYAITQPLVFGPTRAKEVVGYQNLDELKQKLAARSICWKKAECLDLPERVWAKRVIPMSTKQRSIYDQMADELITEVSGSVVAAANALSKAAKLRQIAQGWLYTTKEGGHGRPYELIGKEPPKLASLLEVVNEAHNPVLVFVDFVADLDLIQKALTKKKISFVSVDASVPREERARRCEVFNRGQTKVAIMQTACTKYGLTMNAADTAVFYSNGWQLENRLQAQDRLHRIGQDKRVTYIDLLMEDSVDVSLHYYLTKMKKMADRLAGDEFARLVKGLTHVSEDHGASV